MELATPPTPSPRTSLASPQSRRTARVPGSPTLPLPLRATARACNLSVSTTPGAVAPMAISTIGRYQILERLGQGGMGVVYRAFDPQIERDVAIKVISAQLVDQSEHRERFFREARAAGRLAHKNIITIFDLGEDNGQPYIAMEYVEGQSLEARMRSGEPLTLSQKVATIIDICDALAFRIPPASCIAT